MTVKRILQITVVFLFLASATSMAASTETVFVSTNEAHDVSFAVLDDDTGMFVLAWCDDIDDAAYYSIQYANGTSVKAKTAIDSGAGDSCRIAVSALSDTTFVVAYVDWVSTSSDWNVVGYYTNGTTLFNPVTIDADMNANVDVSVCALNASDYATVVLDNTDNDATFAIYRYGTTVKAQTDLDVGAAPDAGALDQDGVDCAALSSNSWVFTYYDDSPDEVAFAMYDGAGTNTVARTTVSASATDGATSTAALADGGFVIAYCDSTDDDISFQTYDASGNALSGELDVDQSITGCSGAAQTHVSVSALNTTDGQFVVIYDDTAVDDVYVAVYNSSGSEILGPTDIEATSDTVEKAVAVAGYDKIREKSLCKHTNQPVFLAGYNDATNGVWRTYYANGVEWDGNCTPRGAEVMGSLGKSQDGWSGAVPVYMSLHGGLNNTDFPYARTKVDTPAGGTYYTSMTWDAADNRFEGTIYVGSWYCNGCADPNTGRYNVTVQLDDNSDFSSIDYSAKAGSFTTFITRRWNSVSTSQYNYTDFKPTWSVDHWDYVVDDFMVNAPAPYNRVAVAIPFHPTSADITNMAVSFNGVSVSQGNAASETNAWWWDSATHTLYVQMASLSTTYVRVDLDFDSDTDLFATRYDRTQSPDLAERLFYNGLIISNNYTTTQIFGGGHEGSGEQIDLHGKEIGADEQSVDCMERVAVHVNDSINADSSGYYNANIKWKQDEWASLITTENNSGITVVVNSDNTSSTGWKQQLDTAIIVQRTQVYYAGERYIKNVYQLTNNGTSTRKYPIVWGREQWVGTDRQVNDKGRFDGDTQDRAIEANVSISSLTDKWMVSYDNVTFGAMGVIFQYDDPADYGYFLAQAAITATTPYAEWPVSATDRATTQADNTFFERTYSTVAAGASVNFTFWQWGFDAVNWSEIEAAIEEDALELGNSAPSITVAANDGGSSSTTPTQEPNNVVFTITATDAQGDQYKLLLCDSSGQSGGACSGTQYCVSSLTNTGVQASCSHASTGKSGSYSWRAYACDNQSACIEDGNAASPFYVNNEPTWTGVSKDASTKKYGDTITMTSSGAADSEGDTLRLECGSASGSYSLCTGTYGSGQRSCSFSSPWDDNANHTVYCVLNDSFSYSSELNDTVTSYTQPSVYLTNPANNSNKSSTTVSFTWTVVDMGDSTLTCNLTVDGSVNKSGISVSNNTAYTENVADFSEGTHNWTAACWDSGGYTATNSTLNFVVDSVKPALSGVARAPATIGIGGNVTVNATASDTGTGLKGVWVNLTYPNGTKTQYSMTSLGSNVYQYNITGAGGGNQTFMKGRYAVTVWTQDWAGNTNISSELTFDTVVFAQIAVEVNSSTYGANQQVNLTAASWLNNTGTESLSGFLVMKVMRFNGSLEVGDCETTSVIVNDRGSGIPRTIGAGSVLQLDTLWNAAPWNTGSSKDGMYAVYAAFTDDLGKPIHGGNDTEIEASDEFSIETISLLSGGSVSPSSGNTSTLFNYTVTYTSAPNTPPSSINATIDGVSYTMAAANASDTDYTDGKLYYYNTTLACRSHAFSFETSDGTNYDRTNIVVRSPSMNPRVDLPFGWNMISFPLDTTTFIDALSSIAGKYEGVVYWNGVEFTDYINLQDQVDETLSYWVYINEPAGATLEFNGQEFSARRKRAFSGGACTGDSCWVSVGLNSVNGKSMDDVMRGMQINADYRSVVYLNKTDGLFKSYINDPVGNDYNQLKVGLGYYLQVNQNGCIDCVLDYKP